MEIVASLLIVAFVAVSILLILTVLIQRPAGGGLSGAFGSGAGSGQTAFGAKTGDALTIATIIMFVVWLLLAVGLAYVTQPSKGPEGEPEAAAPAGTTGTDAPKQDGTAPASDQPADAPSTPPAEPATPPAEGAQNPPEGPQQPPADQPK